ncbi:TRAP transporter small permease [uncultured Mailhella sp.]|uniref:TRAP transporter small permease n=1 Tax=uncultured Mailhella sp. TaxID=1981031 RepID=UPI003208FBA4
MKKSLLNLVDDVTDYVGMFFLCVMCVVILVQIVFRYAFHNALAWPEEVARFSFIWATYFAISMCMKGDQHLRITLLQTFISKSAGRYVDVMCMLLNIVFFAVCIFLSCDLAVKVRDMEQMAVSIPLPVWIVWTGIPLGCALTLIQAVRNLWNLLFNHHAGAAGQQRG